MAIQQLQADDRLRIGIRDENGINHWRSAGINFSLRSKPKKILMLPGNGTNDARAANGMCKVVEELLGEQAQNCDICGFYYPDGGKTYSPAERALKLLDEYIVPLIANKTPLGDLKRLSWEEACENMRNVVIVTHCYGSRIMAEMDKKLDEIMQQIGYSAEEIKDIHRQLFVFHQNSTRENLGQEKLNSTNLYRVTQADERNRPVASENDSFPNYVATELLEDNEILLVPINENEQALIVAQITDCCESEHNGAYWIKQNQKLPAAQQEEDIFKSIFREAVCSRYHIENWQQIYDNTQRRNIQLQKVLPKIREYGQDYIDDYHDLQSAMHSEYKQAMLKMSAGVLNAEYIDKLSSDALFVTDDKKKNLLDYAVEKGDVQSAKNLWNAMQKYMPDVVLGERLKLTYEDYSFNCLEAKEKQKSYLQKALNSDNPQLFAIFSKPEDFLLYLDYAEAGEKTAFLAGAAYGKLSKQYRDCLPVDYQKGLQSLYHRCKQSNNTELKRKILPMLSKNMVDLQLKECKITKNF